MKRISLAFAATGAALALGAPAAFASAAPASAASAARAPAASASCSAAGDAPLGLTRIEGRRTLARFEPRTLRPRPSPRIPVPLRVVAADTAFSPACDAVALRVGSGRVVLIDLERGRRSTLTLGDRPAVGRLAWPRADRLSGITGPFPSQRIVTVSVPDGRVVADHRVGGRPWVSEATSLGMVALAGRSDRIGPVTLALATPDGGMLRARLTEIRAGYQDRGPRAHARVVTPGLAVDEAGGRAYVVAAKELLVAEVDLASGAVTYHDLQPAGRAAGPVARAADRVPSGPYRIARWLGDGTIAVAGGDVRPKRSGRRHPSRGLPAPRIDPDGLRLIRTDDWSVTTLDPLVADFRLAGGALAGMRWVRATGLAVYGADGSDVFARTPGSLPIGLVGAAWPYAYVTAKAPRRTRVVDLRTGRTVNTLRSKRPPALLVP
jgi:hypothetical protein